MTKEPMTPERIAEIDDLCRSVHARNASVKFGDPRYVSSVNSKELLGLVTAIPELLAEVRAMRAQLDLARRITPFSPEPCPLCEPVKSCAMHARIDEQSETIEKQRARVAYLETALLESVAEAQRASAVVDAATALCAALDRLRCATTQADRERMGLERLYAMRDLERAVARSQPKPAENSTPTSKGPT